MEDSMESLNSMLQRQKKRTFKIKGKFLKVAQSDNENKIKN